MAIVCVMSNRKVYLNYTRSRSTEMKRGVMMMGRIREMLDFVLKIKTDRIYYLNMKIREK